MALRLRSHAYARSKATTEYPVVTILCTSRASSTCFQISGYFPSFWPWVGRSCTQQSCNFGRVYKASRRFSFSPVLGKILKMLRGLVVVEMWTHRLGEIFQMVLTGTPNSHEPCRGPALVDRDLFALYATPQICSTLRGSAGGDPLSVISRDKKHFAENSNAIGSGGPHSPYS